MSKIVITDLTWQTAPTVDQTVTIQYRLESDPDVPASYVTVASNVTVQPSGHLPVPVEIPGLLPSTGYVVWATNNCGGAGFKKLFVTLGPTCPDGYTLSPDGTYCYREDRVPADYIGGGSPYTICRNVNDVYNTYQTKIYKVDGYGTNGVPLAGAGNTPVNLTTSPLWYNVPNGSGHGNTTDGPLNRIGIWPCRAGGPCGSDCPPTNIDVGFSRQFIVPESKIYYVGVGADNFSALYIQDGVVGQRTIFEQNPGAIANYYFGSPFDVSVTFKMFHVYPVFLNAGPNILTMVAQNQGSAAVMGVEVYNNTEAQILASDTLSDLNIIFSTDPNQPFINLGENFDAGNYSCDAHPGYSLVYDSGTNTYWCAKIETVPPSS